KTFFYFTWESMRYPRQSTIQNSVPTTFVKNGDFSREGVTIVDPYTRTPFPGNIIPANRISSVSKQVLAYYPDINFGTTDRFTTNKYRNNVAADVNSDQYDARIDHTFNANHSMFARFNTKNNPALGPNNLKLPSDTSAARYYQGTASWTWTIRPTLLN